MPRKPQAALRLCVPQRKDPGCGSGVLPSDSLKQRALLGPPGHCSRMWMVARSVLPGGPMRQGWRGERTLDPCPAPHFAGPATLSLAEFTGGRRSAVGKFLAGGLQAVPPPSSPLPGQQLGMPPPAVNDPSRGRRGGFCPVPVPRPDQTFSSDAVFSRSCCHWFEECLRPPWSVAVSGQAPDGSAMVFCLDFPPCCSSSVFPAALLTGSGGGGAVATRVSRSVAVLRLTTTAGVCVK